MKEKIKYIFSMKSNKCIYKLDINIGVTVFLISSLMFFLRLTILKYFAFGIMTTITTIMGAYILTATCFRLLMISDNRDNEKKKSKNYIKFVPMIVNINDISEVFSQIDVNIQIDCYYRDIYYCIDLDIHNKIKTFSINDYSYNDFMSFKKKLNCTFENNDVEVICIDGLDPKNWNKIRSFYLQGS